MKEKCVKCGREYTLGVDGTVDGCDPCEKVVRNIWGQIIFGALVMFMLTGCFQPVATAEGTVKERRTVAQPTQADPLPTQPDPTATPQVVTLCGDVNVRPGAGEHGAVIRWMQEGETPTVLEWADGWARIGEGEWITIKAVCR